MRCSKHYKVLFNVNFLLINKLFAGRVKKSNEASQTHIPPAIASELPSVLCYLSRLAWTQVNSGAGFKAHLLIVEEHPPLHSSVYTVSPAATKPTTQD